MKLKQCENGILYESDPFCEFIGDCCSCSNYKKSEYSFVEGGDCLAHHITCGPGFTCKDNDSSMRFNYEFCK